MRILLAYIGALLAVVFSYLFSRLSWSSTSKQLFSLLMIFTLGISTIFAGISYWTMVVAFLIVFFWCSWTIEMEKRARDDKRE